MTEKRLRTGSDFTWRNLEVGNVITETGNAALRRTGDWRTQRLVTDVEKCNKCGLCWLHCPDAIIGRIPGMRPGSVGSDCGGHSDRLPVRTALS